MIPNPIAPTVDFEADGIQHGFLRLPWSRNESAWGNLMIPITVVRNGFGPTALLTGGSHGDEYEGPIALSDLARNITLEEVNGRIIIVPFLNYPAFRAGTRLSPIDAFNLNRTFPGRPDGSVTEKIADFVLRVLVPMADLVLDFHSGGKTLDFLPFAACHVLENKEQERRCREARDAFSAPYSMTMLEIDNVGMLDTEVEALGKIFVTTELGGGGTATSTSAGIAKRGVRNVLKHMEILAGEREESPSVALDMPGPECFCFSEAEGFVEPLVDLGAKVKKGDPLLYVHPVDRLDLRPGEYRAGLDGILASRHFPGLTRLGDCLAVVAVPDGSV
ncbi:N(2)-acetyl-L-2,4-diaminobutanoate deacetylase DoeB [Afifella sp. IM 167]|uniref:N(2)-acetyl-L-2,4-diaminobutanoate deacetylase DoeB n=1 Tax=Afifella sp. IM 167 TaxID=2033586 RepID=UPI001CCB4749|nr:N(2)-acetyl-L-2,4-diaminobutanoate deacetylase DoeB [Afifella sp. IM 167]MBZ8132490.1 N-alpha-acetyl diaminobutyric acid deacetylase DoeB [Afifella sp. IM 167]